MDVFAYLKQIPMKKTMFPWKKHLLNKWVTKRHIVIWQEKLIATFKFWYENYHLVSLKNLSNGGINVYYRWDFTGIFALKIKAIFFKALFFFRSVLCCPEVWTFKAYFLSLKKIFFSKKMNQKFLIVCKSWKHPWKWTNLFSGQYFISSKNFKIKLKFSKKGHKILKKSSS